MPYSVPGIMSPTVTLHTRRMRGPVGAVLASVFTRGIGAYGFVSQQVTATISWDAHSCPCRFMVVTGKYVRLYKPKGALAG